MDKRLTFNEDAPNYDRARPSYPAELFRDVLDYAVITAQSRALEIGIGTGQATLPFLQAGCHVTAIELGQDLATYTRSKFASFPNLDVLNLDFAQYDGTGGAFDLIYSATAFHWIPSEIGLPRIMHLLKPGAAVALFWNHPFRDDDPLHRALQAVYAQFYGPSDEAPGGKVVEFSAKDCAKHTDALERHGFEDIAVKLYRRARQMSADDYIALLNTYSDHRLLPSDRKCRLLNGIHEVIVRFGGTIALRDTIDLYLAKRPG